MWVALIQIWHRRHKPAIYSLLKVNFAGIRIQNRSQLIAGLLIHIIHSACTIYSTYLFQMFRSLVFRKQPLGSIKPVFGWHISYPRMLKTAMVENHIHHNLQSFQVSLINQLFVFCIGTETRIYTIVIGSSITMISTVLAIIRAIILQYRSKP